MQMKAETEEAVKSTAEEQQKTACTVRAHLEEAATV